MRPRRIVVIGGGIVGSAVAEQLSTRKGCSVVVLEQGPRGRLCGSTGHAPGFVGLLGSDPALDELARASVEAYQQLAWRGAPVFHQVGALELAEEAVGVDSLLSRAAAAVAAGLDANSITPAMAAELAPRLVDPRQTIAALSLPSDGVADGHAIVAALRDRAEAAGARFLYGAEVVGIEMREERVAAVRTPTARLAIDDVVLACGVWGSAVASLVGIDLPLFPAGHPYVYSPRYSRHGPLSPLIRWPRHGIYAREHGDRAGLGVSAHEPLLIEGKLDTAEIPLPPGKLAKILSTALEKLPPTHRWVPRSPMLGVLSLTPDGLPLLGRLGSIDGLWSAQAIWITHAAGAARKLASQMLEDIEEIDRFSPGRFDGEPRETLRRRAAETYGQRPRAPAPTPKTVHATRRSSGDHPPSRHRSAR